MISPFFTIQMKAEWANNFQQQRLVYYSLRCSVQSYFTLNPKGFWVVLTWKKRLYAISVLSRKTNQYVCIICVCNISSTCFLIINWVFESRLLLHKLTFPADRRLSYLLNTLTCRLLFDSMDSSLGIPARSKGIPRRFITLKPLKPCSQEETSKKHTHTYTHVHTQLLDIVFFVNRKFFFVWLCILLSLSHCHSLNTLAQCKILKKNHS